jgi:hypothetical protein
MTRDIPALLAEIERRAPLPHAWERGRCCVSSALACVKAQTGVDHLAGLPHWTTLEEALEVARSVGGLRAALDAAFNRTPPAFAMRGDIAALPDAEFGLRLMIVDGNTLVGPGEHGQDRLPRHAMRRAWSIAP